MLTQKEKVSVSNPVLASRMAAVETEKAANGDVGKLFDGTFIKALIAWAIAHPDQITAIIAWILTMFGVPIPVLTDDETPTP